MGLLDDAIREHLDLKRLHGAREDELARQEAEAFGPVEEGELDSDQSADAPAVSPADREAGWPFDRVAEGDLAGPDEPAFDWQGERADDEVEVPPFVPSDPAPAGARDGGHEEFGDSPTVAFEAVDVPARGREESEPTSAEGGSLVDELGLEDDLGGPTQPRERDELAPEAGSDPNAVFAGADPDHADELDLATAPADEVRAEGPGPGDETAAAPPPFDVSAADPSPSDPAAIEKAEPADSRFDEPGATLEEPFEEDPGLVETPFPRAMESEPSPADWAPPHADELPPVGSETLIDTGTPYEPVLEHGPLEDEPAATIDEPPPGDPLDASGDVPPSAEHAEPFLREEALAYEPPPAAEPSFDPYEPTSVEDPLDPERPLEAEERFAFEEPFEAEQGPSAAPPVPPADPESGPPTQAWSIVDDPAFRAPLIEDEPLAAPPPGEEDHEPVDPPEVVHVEPLEPAVPAEPAGAADLDLHAGDESADLTDEDAPPQGARGFFDEPEEPEALWPDESPRGDPDFEN